MAPRRKKSSSKKKGGKKHPILPVDDGKKDTPANNPNSAVPQQGRAKPSTSDATPNPSVPRNDQQEVSRLVDWRAIMQNLKTGTRIVLTNDSRISNIATRQIGFVAFLDTKTYAESMRVLNGMTVWTEAMIHHHGSQNDHGLIYRRGQAIP